MEKCIILDSKKHKTLRSPSVNFDFDKTNGYMATWGKTKQEDPDWSPYGPFILDIEVTTICKGPNGELCPFCAPSGTKITMSDGSLKNIEDIQINDVVRSFNTNTNRQLNNNVKEVYKRFYDGDIIEITTEDGNVLRLTPEHEVYTKRGWIYSKDLKETDILIKSKTNCRCCGQPLSNTTYKRYYCSKECYDNSHQSKECPICKKQFTPYKKTEVFCYDCHENMYSSVKNYHFHDLYTTHNSMIQRCFNEKRNNFKYYGDNGITVSESWLNFKNFLNDMESSYNDDLTLDRIDNLKGYSKENCRWCSIQEQRKNRQKFKNSKRLYKNIYEKAGKFRVQFRHNKKGVRTADRKII